MSTFSRPSFIDPDEDFDEEMIILHLVSELQKGNDACLRAVLKELEDECGRKEKRPKTLNVGPRPDYMDSTWGKMLQDPTIRNPHSRAAKLFRRRFRVPFPVYQWIVSECRRRNLFPSDFKKVDITGRPTIPFELKVLGVLRILGRNWCLDDVNESSGISETAMQLFFHNFIRVFVGSFYNDFIRRPDTPTLERIMNVYDKLGVPGCAGSIDMVHLKWDMCPVSIFSLCKGKEGYPTLAYEVVCDHSRKIYSCTNHFWGTINDKTIIKFDEYILAVKEKRVWADVTFKIIDESGEEKIVKGVWFLTDNGYHNWDCLMSPYSICSDMGKIYWSEWIESVRKDVECCFGILKARFRLLREGLRFHYAADITNIFHFCCILHNMLLEFDGLDMFDEEQWDILNPQDTPNDDEYDDNGDVMSSAGERRKADELFIAPVESDVVVEEEPVERNAGLC